MKNNWKRFGVCCITVSFLCILLVMGIIYVIDPFFHYHMPLNGGNAVRDSHVAIYQNPGIARNDSYQAVLTGSSVTENFRVSWFESLFSCDMEKLTIGSGRTINYRDILNVVFKSDNKVKYIFWGLDVFALVCDPEESIQEIPQYLYDDNLINDTSYLLNKDVLFNQIPNMLLNQADFNEDEVYTWDQSAEFGKEIMVKSYLQDVYNNAGEINESVPEDKFLENCQGNLNHIVPFIEEHKDTEFYIFFPPYSILYWHDKNSEGATSAWINAEEYAIKQLLQYNNVKVFFFQDIESIVCDLENYIDHVHYCADINYYMAECMNKNINRVTLENYKERLNILRELIDSYDYETLLLQGR